MEQLEQAVYDTVHSSNISAKEIASRTGMNHQVLLNKANPQCETHKLGLIESLAIQKVTGNTRILSAMRTELDLALNPTPRKSILLTALDTAKEHGDVMKAVQEALTDGRFTAREKEVCLKEADEAIKALEALKATITAQNPHENLKAVS